MRAAGDGRGQQSAAVPQADQRGIEKTKQMVDQASWKIGRFKKGRYKEAAKLFRDLIEARKFPEFLTLPAYDWIVRNEKKLAA